MDDINERNAVQLRLVHKLYQWIDRAKPQKRSKVHTIP